MSRGGLSLPFSNMGAARASKRLHQQRLSRLGLSEPVGTCTETGITISKILCNFCRLYSLR